MFVPAVLGCHLIKNLHWSSLIPQFEVSYYEVPVLMIHTVLKIS